MRIIGKDICKEVSAIFSKVLFQIHGKYITLWQSTDEMT